MEAAATINHVFQRCLHSICRILISFPVIKAAAIIVANCYLLSFVYGQAVALTLENHRENVRASQLFEGSRIPRELGQITDARFFGSEQVVIAIQDLHCHPEVQRKTSKLLSLLDNSCHIKDVYLEGAFAPVDTSWLSRISDEKLRNSLVESLVDDGTLTGAEYYSIVSGRPSIIRPLEDRELYLANFRRLNTLLDPGTGADIARAVDTITLAAGQAGEKYCNSRQKRLLKNASDHAAGKTPPRKYLAFLVKQAGRSGISVGAYRNISSYLMSIDQQKRLDHHRISAELERCAALLRSTLPYNTYASLARETENFSDADRLCDALSQLSPRHNLNIDARFPALARFLACKRLSGKINPVLLIREEKMLRAELSSRLANGRCEKEITFLLSFLPYLQSFAARKITADDYAFFMENYGRFRRLYAKYADIKLLTLLDPYYALLSEFHSVNVRRNDGFVKAMLGNTVNTRPGTALPFVDQGAQAFDSIKAGAEVKVVVAGGFHTEGLSRLLNERRISYVVITPNITRDTRSADEIYSRLSREQGAFLFNAMKNPPVSLIPQEQLECIARGICKLELQKGMSMEEIIASVNRVFNENGSLSRLTAIDPEGGRLTFSDSDGKASHFTMADGWQDGGTGKGRSDNAVATAAAGILFLGVAVLFLGLAEFSVFNVPLAAMISPFLDHVSSLYTSGSILPGSSAALGSLPFLFIFGIIDYRELEKNNPELARILSILKEDPLTAIDMLGKMRDDDALRILHDLGRTYMAMPHSVMNQALDLAYYYHHARVSARAEALENTHIGKFYQFLDGQLKDDHDCWRNGRLEAAYHEQDAATRRSLIVSCFVVDDTSVPEKMILDAVLAAAVLDEDAAIRSLAVERANVCIADAARYGVPTDDNSPLIAALEKRADISGISSPDGYDAITALVMMRKASVAGGVIERQLEKDPALKDNSIVRHLLKNLAADPENGGFPEIGFDRAFEHLKVQKDSYFRGLSMVEQMTGAVTFLARYLEPGIPDDKLNECYELLSLFGKPDKELPLRRAVDKAVIRISSISPERAVVVKKRPLYGEPGDYTAVKTRMRQIEAADTWTLFEQAEYVDCFSILSRAPGGLEDLGYSLYIPVPAAVRALKRPRGRPSVERLDLENLRAEMHLIRLMRQYSFLERYPSDENRRDEFSMMLEALKEREFLPYMPEVKGLLERMRGSGPDGIRGDINKALSSIDDNGAGSRHESGNASLYGIAVMTAAVVIPVAFSDYIIPLAILSVFSLGLYFVVFSPAVKERINNRVLKQKHGIFYAKMRAGARDNTVPLMFFKNGFVGIDGKKLAAYLKDSSNETFVLTPDVSNVRARKVLDQNGDDRRRYIFEAFLALEKCSMSRDEWIGMCGGMLDSRDPVVVAMAVHKLGELGEVRGFGPLMSEERLNRLEEKHRSLVPVEVYYQLQNNNAVSDNVPADIVSQGLVIESPLTYGYSMEAADDFAVLSFLSIDFMKAIMALSKDPKNKVLRRNAKSALAKMRMFSNEHGNENELAWYLNSIQRKTGTLITVHACGRTSIIFRDRAKGVASAAGIGVMTAFTAALAGFAAMVPAFIGNTSAVMTTGQLAWGAGLVLAMFIALSAFSPADAMPGTVGRTATEKRTDPLVPVAARYLKGASAIIIAGEERDFLEDRDTIGRIEGMRGDNVPVVPIVKGNGKTGIFVGRIGVQVNQEVRECVIYLKRGEVNYLALHDTGMILGESRAASAYDDREIFCAAAQKAVEELYYNGPLRDTLSEAGMPVDLRKPYILELDGSSYDANPRLSMDMDPDSAEVFAHAAVIMDKTDGREVPGIPENRSDMYKAFGQALRDTARTGVTRGLEMVAAVPVSAMMTRDDSGIAQLNNISRFVENDLEMYGTDTVLLTGLVDPSSPFACRPALVNVEGQKAVTVSDDGFVSDDELVKAKNDALKGRFENDPAFRKYRDDQDHWLSRFGGNAVIQFLAYRELCAQIGRVHRGEKEILFEMRVDGGNVGQTAEAVRGWFSCGFDGICYTVNTAVTEEQALMLREAVPAGRSAYALAGKDIDSEPLRKAGFTVTVAEIGFGDVREKAGGVKIAGAIREYVRRLQGITVLLINTDLFHGEKIQWVIEPAEGQGRRYRVPVKGNVIAATSREIREALNAANPVTFLAKTPESVFHRGFDTGYALNGYLPEALVIEMVRLLDVPGDAALRDIAASAQKYRQHPSVVSFLNAFEDIDTRYSDENRGLARHELTGFMEGAAKRTLSTLYASAVRRVPVTKGDRETLETMLYAAAYSGLTIDKMRDMWNNGIDLTGQGRNDFIDAVREINVMADMSGTQRAAAGKQLDNILNIVRKNGMSLFSGRVDGQGSTAAIAKTIYAMDLLNARREIIAVDEFRTMINNIRSVRELFAAA